MSLYLKPDLRRKLSILSFFSVWGRLLQPHQYLIKGGRNIYKENQKYSKKYKLPDLIFKDLLLKEGHARKPIKS